GQPLYVNSVASVAQNVVNRINSALSGPQNPTPQPAPYPAQGGFAQPPQNYQYPPAQQQGYNYPGPSQLPVSQPTPQQWPAQYPSNEYRPKPGSGLAIAFAILGSLTWLVSIPYYILMMVLMTDGRLNGGDSDALAAFATMSTLLSIPTAIIFAVWL